VLCLHHKMQFVVVATVNTTIIPSHSLSAPKTASRLAGCTFLLHVLGGLSRFSHHQGVHANYELCVWYFTIIRLGDKV
jgi:hypothetical protein